MSRVNSAFTSGISIKRLSTKYTNCDYLYSRITRSHNIYTVDLIARRCTSVAVAPVAPRLRFRSDLVGISNVIPLGTTLRPV